MNILFVTEDHSTENYGVTTMASQLADELVCRHEDMKVVIAATGTSAVSQDRRIRIEIIPPIALAGSWRWSPHLMRRLGELVAQYEIDLVHIHGVWSSAPWTALQIARRGSIPAIISVHGMWERWFWEQDNPLRVLKKRIYLDTILHPSISKNVTLHALNIAEKQDIRRFLPNNDVCVIPNAIRAEIDRPISSVPERMILFLGRLHPKKGVELLIRAFAQAKLGADWKLMIAGPEETPRYVKMLKELVTQSNLREQVKFIGPVFGDAKEELIRRAWIQVLPTFSEGQAMVNLEAATYGVPSITTFRAGLRDWQQGGGFLVQPKVEEIASALSSACQWSRSERNRRGNQLRNWVIENYSFDAIMPRWSKLYRSLLAKDAN